MLYFHSIMFLLGLALGSFANVCIHRLPAGGSLLHPPSCCPRCGRRIRWRHNVPIVSFLLLRGRCADCHAPISCRYPLIELLTAALMTAVSMAYADRPALLVMGEILTFVLVVISAIDGEHQIIPDVLSIGLAAAGALLSPWNSLLGASAGERVLHALAGAASGFGLMLAVAAGGRAVWKKEALGGGDVKLMAAVGAFMGWTGVFSTLLLGSLSGTAWAAARLAVGKMKRGDYLPFGPFLAWGAWLSWLEFEALRRIWLRAP